MLSHLHLVLTSDNLELSVFPQMRLECANHLAHDMTAPGCLRLRFNKALEKNLPMVCFIEEQSLELK